MMLLRETRLDSHHNDSGNTDEEELPEDVLPEVADVPGHHLIRPTVYFSNIEIQSQEKEHGELRDLGQVRNETPRKYE